MTSRNPVFRAPGWKPRKPWAPAEGRKDIRKRGRAGVRDRRQVLAEEPLCRICLSKGIETMATVVDHIVPLSRNGSDDRRNKQALCHTCHDEKSAAERAADRANRV